MELHEAVQVVKRRYQTDTQRIKDEKSVIEKYGMIFHPSNLEKLSADVFKSFLLYTYNRHWDGIHRQGNWITSNMTELKSTLRLLLDESKPIKQRLEAIMPKNKPAMIKGLGRAVITPILLVVYPTKYAVYNTPVEEGMKGFGIYPDFKNSSFAERYEKVNEIINNLGKDEKLSLWQTDEIWWLATTGQLPTTVEELEEKQEGYPVDYESTLEELIVNKWESIPEFKTLEILQEDGDYIGRHYDTKEVGIIDLLCMDKNTKNFVVIELKRGRESDKVVGQTLRYIGWVKKKLVTENQKVTGIIITREDDKRLKYALEPVKELIKAKFYKISIEIN